MTKLRKITSLALGFTIALLLSAEAFGIQPSVASSTQTVIMQANRKVVKLYGAGGVKGVTGYATGVLVSAQGEILTVWSPLLDTDGVIAVLHDGRRFPAKVMGINASKEIALLKIDVVDLPFFSLADAVEAPSGTRVLAFSNMFKVATGDEPVSVMRGTIAVKTPLDARRGAFQSPYRGPVYVLDCIVSNPGAAGGALVSTDGTLIGLLGKELRNSQSHTWLNYAIPIQEIRDDVVDLARGRSRTLSTSEESASRKPLFDSEEFGLVTIPDILSKTPAYVDRVIEGSPAEKGGLCPDDLIVYVEDELITSVKGLRTALSRYQELRTLRLVVRRGEALVTLNLDQPSVRKRP